MYVRLDMTVRGEPIRQTVGLAVATELALVVVVVIHPSRESEPHRQQEN